eukprot:1309526-Amphidinium_carterae.2
MRERESATGLCKDILSRPGYMSPFGPCFHSQKRVFASLTLWLMATEQSWQAVELGRSRVASDGRLKSSSAQHLWQPQTLSRHGVKFHLGLGASSRETTGSRSKGVRIERSEVIQSTTVPSELPSADCVQGVVSYTWCMMEAWELVWLSTHLFVELDSFHGDRDEDCQQVKRSSTNFGSRFCFQAFDHIGACNCCIHGAGCSQPSKQKGVTDSKSSLQ